MNQTTCELDPCSSKLVYKCSDVLKGTLTKMVDLSLRQGLFIQDWKLAVVKPLIKNIMLYKILLVQIQFIFENHLDP